MHQLPIERTQEHNVPNSYSLLPRLKGHLAPLLLVGLVVSADYLFFRQAPGINRFVFCLLLVASIVQLARRVRTARMVRFVLLAFLCLLPMIEAATLSSWIVAAFAMTLLALPFLKFVGALLLVWIGVKLLAPDEEGHGDVQGSDKLLAAIKTIIVADLVMSVDNVIAIAGAAQNAGEHQFLLVVLGLLISIPIIVWGSQLVIKLMERFPMIITAGGMLLGWIAGGMLVTDPAFSNPDKWQWMLKLPQTDMIKYGASVAGALLVLLAGKIIVARRAAAAPAEQQG